MADAKGGYVERKSVTDIIRSDMQASGKPTGPNDAVLNFNTEVQAGPLGKLPVSMDDLRIGSIHGGTIPEKLAKGMEATGKALIDYMQRKGIDLAETQEFIDFDVKKNGVLDPKKVGAVVLAAASVGRPGGKGNQNIGIIGTDFDNKFSFAELEALRAPSGFAKNPDNEVIQGIANNILKNNTLLLGAAQGAVDSGVARPRCDPSIVVPNVSGGAVGSMDCRR